MSIDSQRERFEKAWRAAENAFICESAWRGFQLADTAAQEVIAAQAKEIAALRAKVLPVESLNVAINTLTNRLIDLPDEAWAEKRRGALRSHIAELEALLASQEGGSDGN